MLHTMCKIGSTLICVSLWKNLPMSISECNRATVPKGNSVKLRGGSLRWGLESETDEERSWDHFPWMETHSSC